MINSVNYVRDGELKTSTSVPAPTTAEKKAALHRDMCEFMRTTYIRKNADYGDSFAALRKEFPQAILLRIGDKYNRLKTLMAKKEAMVTDESLQDTLLDLANYCVMELVEMEFDRIKTSEEDL